MTERSYTAKDIELMRAALREGAWSELTMLTQMERSLVIEDRVRTYIASGVSPEELHAAMQDKVRAEEEWKRQRAALPPMRAGV